MPSKTRVGEVSMDCSNGVALCILLVSAITLCGCEELVVHAYRACSLPGFNGLRSLA
jgi:hypothetical protein